MIQINQIQKRYPGFTLDLSNFTLPEGRISGLVGANGSGKTTTFQLLSGLIAPDGGQASLFGSPSWPLPVSIKQKIGVVFADSGFMECLNPAEIRTVLAGFYPGFDGAFYDSLIRSMNLPLDKPLSSFSTGMRVRMKMIAAISHHPALLILDEPTAGLDIVARHQIYELLQDFMEQPGRSILISSHIASDLESLCDDFWFLHQGELILHEDVDTLLNEYGVVRLSPEQMDSLDLSGAIARAKAPGGWQVLVRDRQFYAENDPDLVIEKGNLDDLILILEEGERL